MTQHYKDSENSIYGYKPTVIEAIPAAMREVYQIIKANVTPELMSLEQK